VLDFSRYYIEAKLDDTQVTATMNWLPDMTMEQVEGDLQRLGKSTPLRYLSKVLPERAARALCEHAGIEPGTTGDQLTREARKTLARTVTQLVLPITGNRGYTYAEVTAGGIPLSDIHLDTMESRLCSGLYFCGEICDVDGRIGGYNFQWAWSSGYVAGVSV
jgi:predicted Rossmann fold flavoprotein